MFAMHRPFCDIIFFNIHFERKKPRLRAILVSNGRSKDDMDKSIRSSLEPVFTADGL